MIQKSANWAAGLTLHGEKVRGPFFNGPSNGPSGQFAVHFTFKVTPKSTNVRITQEEVAVYTVQDEKIVREEFF